MLDGGGGEGGVGEEGGIGKLRCVEGGRRVDGC